jgi:hypothetical protein
MLVEVCDDSYIIDEPFFDFSEIPESVNVEEGILTSSKISDRLFCFSPLRSIEIPSFIHSIESCFRSMEINVATLMIPS